MTINYRKRAIQKKRIAGLDSWVKENDNGTKFISKWQYVANKRLRKVQEGLNKKKYEGIAERQYREKQQKLQDATGV